MDTPRGTEAVLADATAVWQSDRDGGSTPLRAAARAITGVPHYFSADFIDDLDAKALRDQVALRRAAAILQALSVERRMNADEWREHTKVDGSGHASRGIKAKSPSVDDQIEEAVSRPGATLAMPLWGFSLDEKVALRYGDRFLFRLVGSFVALPAWVSSGTKSDEQEMIGGGEYRVVEVSEDGGTTIVDLEHQKTFVPDVARVEELLAGAARSPATG